MKLTALLFVICLVGLSCAKSPEESAKDDKSLYGPHYTYFASDDSCLMTGWMRMKDGDRVLYRGACPERVRAELSAKYKEVAQ